MKPLTLPLFSLGHLVSAVELTLPVFVEGRGTSRQSWFTWSCTCGETAPEDFRASHERLAEDAGRRHAELVPA